MPTPRRWPHLQQVDLLGLEAPQRCLNSLGSLGLVAMVCDSLVAMGCDTEQSEPDEPDGHGCHKRVLWMRHDVE